MSKTSEKAFISPVMEKRQRKTPPRYESNSELSSQSSKPNSSKQTKLSFAPLAK